jgi:nucleoside-diphosphate-sugar epimerase
MSKLVIDTSKPVLVTGGTGYVAGWVIQRLLQEGLTVHATVRNASNTERLACLQRMADDSPGSIAFFEADLLTEGSFAEGMAGCSTVFHIASPYTSSVTDPQAELVDPALNGTRNVLQQVNRTESVTRVVVTSSCAAIFGDAADLADTPDGVFTEAVWNTTSSVTHQPYSYSKTVAEREAWAIAERQDRWRLVVVNPAGVFGPGVRLHHGAESFELFKQMGDGTFKGGLPAFNIGIVDVRDVAEAQLAAAFPPDAEGRHILSGEDSGFVQLGAILREHFPDYPVGSRTLPKWLLWLLGPLVNPALTRAVVSRNIGLPWKADNRKSREALGITYRPLTETVVEGFQQLIDGGVFEPSKG